MPTLTIETEIIIHFDYQKSEKRTKDYPGCPESIEINEVETPQEDYLELCLWEARNEWKED